MLETFDARARHQRRGAAQRGRVERRLLADSDEQRGARRQPAARGYREHVAPFAFEVGLVHEVGERAVDRVVDEVGTRPELAAGEDGDDEQVNLRRAGTDFDDWGHGVGVYEAVSSAFGPRGTCLPASAPSCTRGRRGGSDTARRSCRRRAIRHAWPRRAARSARRTIARARSSAAATRFSPGNTNSVGGFVSRGQVVDDRLEPADHRLAHERDFGFQLGTVRGRGREFGAGNEELALQTKDRARAARNRVRSRHAPGPTRSTASSTDPYASGPASSFPTRPP